MTTPDTLRAWRDDAVAVLKSGPMSPQQLGDRTAVTAQSVVQRARKFPRYFRLIERGGCVQAAKAPIDLIDLDPALRRA